MTAPQLTRQPDSAELTVLFDRDCGLCNWTVRQLRGLDRDRRLEYVSLQAATSDRERPELAAVAARYPLADAVHVVRRDGSVEAGGRAMLAILDTLPGAWLLRPWTRFPGMATIADLLYGPIAANRHVLGRLVAWNDPVRCDVEPDRGRDEGAPRS